MLDIRPAEECQFDVLALGEVMLRLDPGEGRIRTARRFDVWEGGGEYNVARALSAVFGLRTGVVTALVDNEIGRLVESLVRAGGVDTSLISWVDFDGIGRRARNGINFTERGYGVRAALGVSDRAGTPVSALRPGDVDFDDLFGRRGVRWLHTGGVFAGLSESSAALAEDALRAARAHGTVVSYDTNYRPSLWEDRGGADGARAVNTALARHADVVIGNPGDFTPEVATPDRSRPDAPPPSGSSPPAPTTTDAGRASGPPDDLRTVAPAAFAAEAAALAERMPAMRVLATTIRHVHSASDNDWQGIAWTAATGALVSAARDHLAVLDRVGGGDGYAAGLAYGLLCGEDLQAAVDLGAAHGALAMSTPGDNSMATLAEVRALAAGASRHVRR